MGEEPLLPPFLQAVAVPFDIHRRTVMQDPIQHRRSDHVVAEDLSNREMVLPPSPLPRTHRATFTAVRSRISRPVYRAARCEK